MEAVANRSYFDRQDYIKRILLKIPRTVSEKIWEAKNPGYELHAVENWSEIALGSQIWRGYEGEEPSTLLEYNQQGWKFTVTEKDFVPERSQSYANHPMFFRTHCTQWNVKFARIIVKL